MNAKITCDHGNLLSKPCKECIKDTHEQALEHRMVDGECAACNQLIANMDKEAVQP